MRGEDKAPLRFIDLKCSAMGSGHIAHVDHGHGEFWHDRVLSCDGVSKEINAWCGSNKATSQDRCWIDNTNIQTQFLSQFPCKTFGLGLRR